MKGLHLTADLYRCRCERARLADAGRLQAWCTAAVQAAGLQPLAQAFQGQPASVSGTLLLDGGHLCLHVWPQEQAVSADVYLAHANGDPSARARALMAALVERFQPEWTEQRSLERGEEE